LLLTLEQGVEGMEKLFLRAFFTSKKLNVINQQGVYGTIITFEIIDGIVLQRLDHVLHEALGVEVDHLGGGILLHNEIAHGMHEMGLAQSDAAVDKQRVIGAAGVLADLIRGGAGQLIGFALDKIFEGRGRIEAAVVHHPGVALPVLGLAGAARGAIGMAGVGDIGRRAADLQDDLALSLLAVEFVQHLFNAFQQTTVDPVEHEAIGCQQT
jgi:hypothetical protein